MSEAELKEEIDKLNKKTEQLLKFFQSIALRVEKLEKKNG